MKNPDREDLIQKMLDPNFRATTGKKFPRPDDWEDRSISVMWTLLRSKFLHNPHVSRQFGALLHCTFVEGNYWCDNFWGVCHCSKCVQKGAIGKNILGLMIQYIVSHILVDRDIPSDPPRELLLLAKDPTYI